ncbi:Clavaminate synthase-like protein [Rickenella mellea]|uniref:Clavaminate synthase-like protein n=1 Tax=Rickenella mellea TaxID=50990 RepID=A0A4Y7PXP7_9AGAM|nr:Clavaminate synthase-like protein [Rickenella mellea]
MAVGKPLLEAADHADLGFHQIPIIDMQNANHPDFAVRKALAQEIRDACINVGFFYVKNHGIPNDKIQNALDAAKAFFSLPTEEKMKIDTRTTPNFKGYNGLLMENNDPANKGDMHEGFNLGPEELRSTNPTGGENAMSGANLWPSESAIPGFREAVLNYYHSAVAFGKTLFPLFALALELPEHYFDDKTTEDAAIMRVLHYPPQTGPVDDRIIGIGAHTDFECFTILWQEPNIQALQILNANKEWIKAPPIDGTLVLNLGDQFARWTNDVFKSTVHRAINRTGIRRYSIPLFFGTDYNVKLEPIPSCVSAERPPRYEVVTAGDYVKSRLEAAYAATK